MNYKNKLLEGLIKRWCNLIDESIEIFYDEHPFLKGGELVIITSERRYQNEIETEKTVQALCEELRKDISAKERKQEQGNLIEGIE